LAEPNKTVLIAEDEPDNREILRAVVEDIMGYTAVLVEDGASALEVLHSDKPSVVLMDLMMPNIDGFEAISIAKSDPETSHIPIIAVTALSRPSDRQRAMQCGANDCISKPFDIESLMNMIEDML
jgi:CheY-like chemotaxis protein